MQNIKYYTKPFNYNNTLDLPSVTENIAPMVPL